ncbi:hypothetical protein [Curtobacterium flaccumfaciens]|uniref:hypothetical protein n=1 Tax=Curtobacterium flaccumfaciens TaxID=2035 RepID=UPI001ADB2958|nr:hypothetical protein [Curtobacterium flaccumfaciens]MBO9038439.1 hypothetical protein [Curtobacterium flaccumfaciens pv. flaccumfaciens]
MTKPPAQRKTLRQQFDDAASLQAGLTEAQALIVQARPGAQHVVLFSSGDLEVQGTDAGEELARLGQDADNGWTFAQESGDEFEARLGFTNEFLVDGYVKGTNHEQVTALASAISDRLAAAAG